MYVRNLRRSSNHSRNHALLSNIKSFCMQSLEFVHLGNQVFVKHFASSTSSHITNIWKTRHNGFVQQTGGTGLLRHNFVSSSMHVCLAGNWSMCMCFHSTAGHVRDTARDELGTEFGADRHDSTGALPCSYIVYVRKSCLSCLLYSSVHRET